MRDTIHIFVAGCLGIIVGAGILFFLLSLNASVAHLPVTTNHHRSDAQASESPDTEAPAVPLRTYLEVTGGCATHFEGSCVHAYATTSASATPLAKLRTGVVLDVADVVTVDSITWYKIEFNEWLRYPGRLQEPWYIPEGDVDVFTHKGPQELTDDKTASSTKRIIVDRSEQLLTAYDGDDLFLEASVSTGLELTPTPRGTFTVFYKTPSRYMQGPIPGITNQKYDLPGVPWNLYFTKQGAVIHGTFWHDNFGTPWSNGCVNLPPATARTLYEWAELGTIVIIHD